MTYLASCASLVLYFCLFCNLHLFLNHTQEDIASLPQFVRAATFEKPVKAKDRELGDVLLNLLVYVVRRHIIVIEEVAIFFLTVEFAFGGRIIELEFLHGVLDGRNLLEKQRLKVGAFVTFCCPLNDVLFNPRVFYTHCVSL